MTTRARWLVVVAVGVLALVAFNVWWVAEYRHGYPMTIDEAGYTAFALVDHFGLQGGGLHGWWEAVQSQSPYAPLVPAITSLAFVFKAGVLEGFGVLIAFMALLAFATYGIGERLAGPRLGALAALVVAAAPGVFLFEREYVFALPAAALLSCAVFALLRSDGLRSRRWAIASGVALGLMLLARTMTVAFVPGVIVAAIVTVLVRSRDAARPGGEIASRLLNLGLLVASGFAVAATWYVRNFKPVFDYLTSYGYGSQSAYYGPDHSWISWIRWRDVASRMTLNDLLVPLAALVLLGLLTVGVLAVRRVVEADDRRAALLGLLGSDAFSVAVVAASCYVALTSSRNGGEGFTIPISVLLPPLAVVALRHLRSAVVIPVLAILIAITGLNVASNTNLWDSLSQTRQVSVPGFGSLPWLNGTPQAVGAIRGQVPGPSSRFAAGDRGWPEASGAVAGLILKMSDAGAHQPVAFASRNRVLNTSTVLLAGLLDYGTSIWFAQLVAEPDDTVARYRRELTSAEFGMPGMLVTMSSNTDDFPPLITQSYAETAARRCGFRQVRTMTLPDGRLLRFWVKRPY
jgi:4-amino-4-deoxy-L-arabinose transferase-like glycosyltransferase